jgi:hypothetical protein
MSLARIATFAFSGIEAVPVEVQVQLSPGLPQFGLVGLADKAVGESRERVRAALTGLGLSLPAKRVLVNLAPADLAKEGSHYDLPIALALMAAMDVLPREELAGFAALGELSLDGAVLPVAGVLPAALAASARGIGLICPAAQGGEAAWSGRGEVLAAADLPAILNHFRGLQVMTPPSPPALETQAWTGPCLSEVKGQESAKRALEIAAAGGHNLVMMEPVIQNGGESGFGVLVRSGGPFVADLVAARVGVLSRCQKCGKRWVCAPEMVLDVKFGNARLGDVPWNCRACGGTRWDAIVVGPGWSVGPFSITATDHGTPGKSVTGEPEKPWTAPSLFARFHSVVGRLIRT